MRKHTDDRDPFFQERKKWAKYKHEILSKYLHVWAYKLGFRSKDLAFVDTCAGEGTYGKNKEPGSPLIAVQLNDDPGVVRRGGRVIVWACEREPAAAERVQQALTPYIDRGLAHVIPKPFSDAIGGIALATSRIPTLFFVDPFGTSEAAPDKLAPVLDDTKRASTELLVRVSPQDLARFAGQLKRTQNDTEQGRKTAASFRRLLERLGFPNTMLDEAEQGGLPDTWAAIQAYRDTLKGRFRYVAAIPVRDDYFAPAKYFLMHATDSVHGLVAMNDVVSTAEDSLFDARYGSGGQAEMFAAPKREPRVSAEEVEAFVLEQLVPEAQLTRLELRGRMVERWAAEMREKHHAQVLNGLAARKAILIRRAEGKHRDRDWISLLG